MKRRVTFSAVTTLICGERQHFPARVWPTRIGQTEFNSKSTHNSMYGDVKLALTCDEGGARLDSAKLQTW
jgi:hypothetical protein